MKKENLVLSKDLIKRKKFLKNEFKKNILKSITRNFKIKNIIRIEAMRKITYFNKSSSITRQNNICVLTGRFGGVFKKYTLCRQFIKNTAKYNMLHNSKINS